jgi:pyruvate/2-oxoglutarate dehydrogenase complex dihydrolipoamide acyltransferase (E2) component
MASKLDIIAPFTQGSSALMMQRWLKLVGDPVMLNEPIAELVGNGMMVYVHAPSEGSVASIMVGPGQNILSGTIIGQISVVAKDAIEWDNFDQVTAILEDFADKSKTHNQRKDANEALGQLLGVADKDVFRKLDIEQQNKFLQNVVDQYQANGLSPADVAQKLLEGLQLRTPRYGQVAPSGPGFGVRGPAGPAPGGMGGGAGAVHYPQGPMPQQQQGYAPYQPPGQQWPAVPQQGGYPPVMPQQQVPYMPPIPDDDE